MKLILIAALCLVFFACSDNKNVDDNKSLLLSSQADGQAVFRYETFGNEGFWSSAALLPQGIVELKITPVMALRAGLSVNISMLDTASKKAIGDEIFEHGLDGPILNDPATTLKLINANAIIGMVVKDTDLDGKLDVMTGDKVGVSCALCHAVTDKSVTEVLGGGSIGNEIDGPAVHNIQIGAILAMAKNTRAFFPMAQLKGLDGKSVGRAPSASGLTKNSTESEFDAYFSNENFYPRGTFDDTVDGNGNPMHNTPMFRPDLAAPYGSAGEIAEFENFANTVYTVLLDPTNLISSGGRAFLHKAAGAAGDKMVDDYKEVLDASGVINYPYATISRTGNPAEEATLIGIGVDMQKLLDMKAYLSAQRAPDGDLTDLNAIERGRVLFQTNVDKTGCVSCHNVSQMQPVSKDIIEMIRIFPGDNPTTIAVRAAPLSPILNTESNTFDDKMIVINASLRGLKRGAALPLMMDLARKPNFLHDSSVLTLESLLDEARGPKAPHPFYLPVAQRTDVAAYLKSLDDNSDGNAPVVLR